MHVYVHYESCEPPPPPPQFSTEFILVPEFAFAYILPKHFKILQAYFFKTRSYILHLLYQPPKTAHLMETINVRLIITNLSFLW